MTKFSRLVLPRFASHFHSNGTDFSMDTALKLQNSLFLFSCFFMLSMLLANSCTPRDHPFKTSACFRGVGGSSWADGLKVTVHKDPLYKHFAGMPMVGG